MRSSAATGTQNKAAACAAGSGRRGRPRGLKPPAVLAMLLMGSLGPAPVAAQAADRLPPPAWPAELGGAFELYYAGEFLEVQRVCRQLSVGTRDARLRREAAALAAMATMRLPGRSNRIGGRARLAQLAEQDTSLLTRPECQLAYGIAQTALNETATALHHLNQAAKGFARRGQTDRLAEACVALAEAWVRHGEWELPVPELEIPRPENRAQADRIRTEQIGALRERVAALPDNDAYLARIDLVLARHLLETEDGVAKGLTLLEKLTRGAELTAATAPACLALAERYETGRRWAEAARLYARVQAGNLGELSRRAEQRRNAIRQPQLVLDVPGQATPGKQFTVKLEARNVATVELEVRRVDLARWLTERQGRFAEAALPVTGALVAVRNLDTTVAREHDWWRSETLTEPLTFEPPAGAMVVLARAADGEGRTATSKRLVIAGDLQASVFVGNRRAALWALRRGQLLANADEADLRARFWMYGSFVPTRPRFSDGVAIFALPPEARLLRDKRWVCLVEADEQVALCHGALSAVAGSKRPQPAVALIGGPGELRVGAELGVFGLLLGGSNDHPAKRWPQAVALELFNALDHVYATLTAEVSNAGTFSARLPISAAMAGEHLRVVVHLDGQVLENVYRRLSVRVAQADEAPFRVSCGLAGRLRPPIASVAGQVEVAYPWGTAVSGASASTWFRAVRLRTVQPKREQVHSNVISGRGRLDAEGKWEFAQPLADFHLPDGPLAVGLWADVAGWDGRQRRCFAEALIGPEPIHLWLRYEPDTPRVAEPLYVSVGWFDPTGRATGARPTVAVWRDGAPVTDLQLLPATDGLRSRTWRPTVPGAYELVATLPVKDGDPVIVRDCVRVEGRHGTDQQNLTPVRFEARFTRHEGRPHVRVRLDARRRHPVLALLEAGDPLGARQLPSLDGPTDVFLPLTGPRRADTRLVLVAPGPEGVQILGAAKVRPADADALTLVSSVLSPFPSETATSVTVRVAATRRGTQQPVREAILVARLVDASGSGGVQWLPGEGRPDLALLPGGIQVISSAAAAARAHTPDTGGAVIPETRELSAELARALFEDPTLWVASQPSADGAATFTVPLPPKPGLYRLVLMAGTPDGALVSDRLDLDTRRDIQPIADAPRHLAVGDRTVVSLVITNNEPTATQARVTCDGGRRLHVDGLRPVGGQAHLEQSEGSSCALTVPGSAVVTLHAGVEATQPGTGTLAFVVETKRGRRRTSASCQIHAAAPYIVPPEEASRESIVIRRTLFLLEERLAAERDAFAQDGVPASGRKEWLRIEVRPGERLSPGDLVLVQEEFSLEQPLAQVEWKQRLPGNCSTHARASDWSDLRQLGTRRDLRLEALTHVATRLDAGRRYIHEYVIVAVRPGACQFPSPSVRAAGAAVPVEVAPAGRRVLVAESK